MLLGYRQGADHLAQSGGIDSGEHALASRLITGGQLLAASTMRDQLVQSFDLAFEAATLGGVRAL